eukprot:scaffold134808_cov19-Tisochrysis_lutea.AAC.1
MPDLIPYHTALSQQLAINALSTALQPTPSDLPRPLARVPDCVTIHASSNRLTIHALGSSMTSCRRASSACRSAAIQTAMYSGSSVMARSTEAANKGSGSAREAKTL